MARTLRTGDPILHLRRIVAGVVAAVLLAAGVSSLGGCTSPPTQGKGAVESTVRAYNDALAVAFEQLDMNELNQTATQEQAEREFLLMAALGEGRMQMRSRLVSIEFGEVTYPSDDAARVTTTEVWDYEHVSLDTSETVRSERGVTYHLQYDLVRGGDRWLVATVTSLDDPASTEDTSAGGSSGQ